MKLYKKMQGQTTTEGYYMSCYAHEAVEKFSLKESMGEHRWHKQEDDSCKHGARVFASGNHNKEAEQSRQTRAEANPATAASLGQLTQSNF